MFPATCQGADDIGHFLSEHLLTVDYDSATNTVTGISYTSQAYGADLYYQPYDSVYIALEDGSQIAGGDGFSTEEDPRADVYLQVTGDGCQFYQIVGQHWVRAYYYVTNYYDHGVYLTGYLDDDDYNYYFREQVQNTFIGSYTFTGQGPSRAAETVFMFLGTTVNWSSGNCNPPPCAHPINFHQVGNGTDTGSGTLHFVYAWNSNSGYLSDLSACTVGENVTYPGTGNYFPPSPRFPTSGFTNPTVIDRPATEGGFQDNHSISGSFVTPYTAASFTGTQYYRYKCPCANSGNYVNLVGPLNIDRSVSSAGGPNWKYTITKSGASATINPLP